jgi:ribonuclease HI
MQASQPHFLLFSESTFDGVHQPRWKFVLQSVGGEHHFSAGDTEYESRASRLELLAVVRGLEALDQPSRVTLITRSRYVRRGIRRELNQWRDRRWRWERFGNVVPIRDHDLWQRVDRALRYHQLECCAWADDATNCQADAARRHALRRAARPSECHHRGWNVAALLGGLSRSVLMPISNLVAGAVYASRPTEHNRAA